MKTDTEHKQNKSEILHKRKNTRISTQAEMAKQNTDEENPGRTDGDSLELESAQVKAKSDYRGKKQDGMGYAGTEKQIMHKY